MDNSEIYKRHLRNVQNETNNPSILNDVVDSELGQYPDRSKKRTENSNLTQVQEIARDSIDGKTWQDLDDQ